MTFRRIVASLLLATGALAVSVAPATAHTELKSSNPPAGAALDTAPAQLELTFTEPVTLPADAIQVVHPGGAWTIGTASVAGPVVTVPVTPSGPAGAYTINWKVVSADGDPVSGTIPFTLAQPAGQPTTSAPPATTTTTEAAGSVSNTPAPAAQSEGGGFPAWAWVVIGLVVVGLAVGGFLLSRRQSA